jgi:hypothetical protein
MFMTATVHPDVIESVASDCFMVYRSNRIWPLSKFTPRGPGRGIMAPKHVPAQAFVPLTIGVFEVSNCYELAWKEGGFSDHLHCCVGSQGKHLKTAIALREIERLSLIHNFKYKVLVKKDGNIRVTIRSQEHVS